VYVAEDSHYAKTNYAVYVDAASVTEYPKTLAKLRQLGLQIDKIISGHWSAIHSPDLIDRYLAMLKEHSET
jgi:hypothetical protein